MSQVTLNRRIPRIGFLQIAIIVLAVVTGLVHLDRGIMMNAAIGHFANHAGAAGGPPRGAGGPRGSSILSLIPIPLPILFDLNFVAYIVLAATLYLPALHRFQSVIRWLLIALAVVTIIMWYLVTHGSPNVLAYIDKPIEVALIVLLLIDARQASQHRTL